MALNVTSQRHPRVNRSMRFRRECSFTMLYNFSHSDAASGTAAPTMQPALEYAFQRVGNLVSVIDWVGLAKLTPSQLGIPSWPNMGGRFITSLSLEEQTWNRLNAFRDTIKPEFDQLKERGVYLNFALAMLLRAPLALDKRVLPFKLPTDELLGVGAAPAAFEPTELLGGSSCMVPSDPARKKHMTFARIDPSIFDQSDLFPNGKVDAEGYADASELL